MDEISRAQLVGAQTVDRVLGLPRSAFLVANYRQAVKIALLLSECWLGPSSLIIPRDGDTASIGAWSRMLNVADIDRVIDLDHESEERVFSSTHNLDELPVSQLAAFAFRRGDHQYKPVKNYLVPDDSSLFVSFLLALGRWPAKPTAACVSRAGLLSTLDYSEYVSLTSVHQQPRWRDLLSEASTVARTTPRALCSLSATVEGDKLGDSSTDAFFTECWPNASALGRRVVIIYRPGNLEDFCLAWNVRTRTATGVFPLAIPWGRHAAARIRHALRYAPHQILGEDISASAARRSRMTNSLRSALTRSRTHSGSA